jgi:PqqD family protein of HPr-rel-A system
VGVTLVASAVHDRVRRLFRLRGSAEPRLYAFDDEVAAFNPVTWNTHLLDASAAIVLEALARAPATAEAIAPLLSGCRAAAGTDARRLTAALLDELVDAGLIEAETVDAPR